MTVNTLTGACPVCGGSHWHWTEFHGVALCGVCGVTSAMPKDGEEGAVPVSTLKVEWLPKYRRWWAQSKGACTFLEWLDAGERALSEEELKAFRAEKERKRIQAVLDRPVIHIKPWSGVTDKETGAAYYHVGLYGPQIKAYLGEAKDLETARRLGHAAAYALEAVLGYPISFLTQLGQGFQEWLDQDDFSACHPKLSIQYSRPGWSAHLHDSFGHGMMVGNTGESPRGTGETPEAAVAALLDKIRGEKISFWGYHSGSFQVPSDLVMDWKEETARPEPPPQGKVT